jgi:hypothetical protein
VPEHLKVRPGRVLRFTVRCASTALCALLALPLGGCGLIAFDYVVDIPEQRVEGAPAAEVPIVGGFVTLPFDVDLEAATEGRNVGPIERIHLQELQFGITGTAEGPGDTDDLDFVDTMEIYAESAQAASALPRVLVATYSRGTASGLRRITARVVPDVDIIDYVTEGAILSTEATGRVPPDDVTFNGVAVLTLEAL